MNNSVRVAQKHYLQITDDHHLAGCGITPESKAVSPAVTAASFMPIHAPSAKTQTLENKAFPVTDHHDPSQEMPKWAMREPNPSAFDSVKIGLIHLLGKTEGSNKGSNSTLSELTGRLIERWDSLTKEERLMLNLFMDWDEVMDVITPASEESLPED
jgi:hypothetical protein